MTQSMVFIAHREQELTKQQKKFNSLVQKIEQLKLDLISKTKRLDQKLAECVERVLPQKSILSQTHEKFALTLAKYLDAKGLGRRQQEVLKEAIYIQIRKHGDFCEGEFSAAIKALIEKTEGRSFQDIESEEFRNTLEEAILDFNCSNEEAEEIRKCKNVQDLFELMPKLRLKYERSQTSSGEESFDDADFSRDHGIKFGAKEKTKSSKTKKSKASIDRELQKQAQKNLHERSLSALYKQIVRVIHPDLEQDPVLRAEKETLLKKLTVAYESKDLVTLLQLEVECLNKDASASHVASMTDEHLAIYIDSLKQQIGELKSEFHSIAWHPRYECLREYASHSFKLDRINLDKIVEELKQLNDSLQHDLRAIDGPNGLRALKDLLKFVSSVIESERDLFEVNDEFFATLR